MARLKTAVLISGRGSNMLALAEAARDPAYPAEIALVLSNRPAAAGLDSARALGIEALAIAHKEYPDRAAFDRAVSAALKARGIELVALAGFMRILTPGFIADWRGRMLNIHPSLLPKYPGLDTHARAIAAGDREAGCTVHVVTEELDDGPIVAQARVPLEPSDTAQTLAARVLVAEHGLYPQALALHAQALLTSGNRGQEPSPTPSPRA
ncbi:phosphoribosylglycinamide formyltransferase [Sandaracinobacter sp. RS1-74]|uniref:phosphoribosylglycinamide formyltransferase n=1 Tax=Sandaracinobacteroides sayramensis TaxID=2913411 RepID=UPI001EDC85DB|nr:phosphoribosylglycinamide formyltransferase [Sandaracinobacteroides sayramensis]MCG2842687.1 phosphoribosylglycinamide formyltransferase [Sandaracinobacteroides sayramensis]